MKKTATFIIHLEWDEKKNKMMSGQIARDKIFIPMQEMWIMGHLSKADIEEIEQVSLLSHGNKKGKRQSFYKTGFPAKHDK